LPSMSAMTLAAPTSNVASSGQFAYAAPVSGQFAYAAPPSSISAAPGSLVQPLVQQSGIFASPQSVQFVSSPQSASVPQAFASGPTASTSPYGSTSQPSAVEADTKTTSPARKVSKKKNRKSKKTCGFC
jgi:hypothetical protein